MKIKKIMLIAAIILILCFGIKTIYDYLTYSPAFDSAPFHVTVLVNAILFLGAAVILLLIRKLMDK